VAATRDNNDLAGDSVVVVMPANEPRDLTKAKGEVKKLLMNEQKRKSQ
jgi:hypothetical protein